MLFQLPTQRTSNTSLETLFSRNNLPIKSNDNNNNATSSTSSAEGQIRATETEISSNSVASRSTVNTLLPTACVLLKGHSGRTVRVRALLDQGSQASFVSESVVQLFKAERKRRVVDVSGIGGMHAGKASFVASFTIEPISGEGPVIPLNALVLQKLTSYIPKPFVLDNSSSVLMSLKLADPESASQEKIELIIGADYYGSMLRDGVLRGHAGNPSAQLTVFGWVLFGPVRSPCSNVEHERITSNHITATDSLDDLLQKFWELEDVPHVESLSEEETRCEKHFLETHSRQSDDRYIVRLPFKTPPPLAIGETETDAKRLFLSNEARLAKIPDVANAYKEFMLEYERLNHMEKIPKEEIYNKNAVYFPHHAVVKEVSQTTKVRVVFNASRMSSNKTSLNDHLLIGPKLHADLSALILRWRTHKYVYITDIEKMFRQILVHKADAEFQRIFWRHESHNEVQFYRLLTVTYGTASAPYLANRVLKQLASDEKSKFPLAARVLESCVYVDDLMFGDEDIETLKRTREQLAQLLTAGGFKSHKWASNNPCLLTDLPPSEHSLADCKALGEDSNLKILGILWSPAGDAFKMHVLIPNAASFTKRTFLSLLSRIFDPLGWVAPVTISAKIIMQRLWLSKVKWDEPLPVELSRLCLAYQSQLKDLRKISIPRWTGGGTDPIKSEIHGFSDASNSAYAAVVYLKIETIECTHISLLYAKTRVAPIKAQSIPRLELCAALLLVQAIDYVQRVMNLSHIPVFCWTDSSVVLSWLRSIPSRWTTFVANRVSSIITTLPNAEWRHVHTSCNPADCASRGIHAEELLSHPLWWAGPSWLKNANSEWPVNEINAETETEKRQDAHSHVIIPHGEWNLPDEYSSWIKLVRVTAYIKRFIYNLRVPQARVRQQYLTADEIIQAKQFWLQKVQRSYFSQEIRDLQSNKCVNNKSTLLSLNPGVDSHGVLRVGGRLCHANLNENEKFPVILPKCRVSELIIRYMHFRTLHGGLQSTLRMLRQQYWVLGARNSVKYCISNCVTCARQRAALSYQRMGDLPDVRVKPSRPFANTGIDYAGPFHIKSAKGRGQKTHKGYCALFICLATRAIHLEVADDYSTEGFLAAFERFTARRGIPSVIFSDNGTNFRGADRELTRRLRELMKDETIHNYFSNEEIHWRFIPPAVPQFGGLWEAGVKSVKFHLKRILGNFSPTFEEFYTLLYQIECILNSRPIAPLFDDPESFDALTPGHFLVGSHLKSVPTPHLGDIKLNRLSRWQTIQLFQERFWKVWSADYLNSLQQRKKWRTQQNNLEIGDLVLLRSAHLPPTKWEMGRILHCHPGADTLVRVVTVKTAKSVFKRPVTQLCRLPIANCEM